MWWHRHTGSLQNLMGTGQCDLPPPKIGIGLDYLPKLGGYKSLRPNHRRSCGGGSESRTFDLWCHFTDFHRSFITLGMMLSFSSSNFSVCSWQLGCSALVTGHALEIWNCVCGWVGGANIKRLSICPSDFISKKHIFVSSEKLGQFSIPKLEIQQPSWYHYHTALRFIKDVDVI